ncbi:MAG TPA: DUF6259 domain-containing protein, partial [Acidimicrobiia bacterium]|nr:DUF6259 domain-containing protein [Acidimicrobiia bacterium]
MMFREHGGNLMYADEHIEVTFDGATGGISRLRNVLTDQLMVDVADPVPWRMQAQGRSHRWFTPRATFTTPNDPEPSSFRFSVSDDGTSAVLDWDTSSPGVSMTVLAGVAMPHGIALWPEVLVETDTRPPVQLTYPVLTTPKEMSSDGLDDRLVFPGHAGWLISAPLAVDGLDAPYPDGYIGASMQFMAYFTRGVGGFYLATHDPHATAKRIRFSPEEAAFDHEAYDIRAGASLELDYPVVLATLDAGDWYSAADRYRGWALINAPWCRDHVGNATDLARDGSRWLFEEVGVSVWCAPARLDWSQWYRHYADVAGTPVHIVPAWDWPESLPPSRGESDVFPATFHSENVEAWKGHRVTPYLNDLFVSPSAPDFIEKWEPNVLFPYVVFPWMPFSEPTTGWVDGEHPGPDPATTTNYDFFLCPVTGAHQELHAWRDTVLAEEYGLDGVFYDISSGNTWPWSRCLRTEHGHPPGRGREIVQAYETLNRRSKESAWAATGRYLVQGTEVIQEPVIGSVDFYVSRACAGPMGWLETERFGLETEPGGGRELIPLFQAVYHDVGPVHEDGWITLAEREGDFFYFVAARIALVWGGILSLQYCTEPPEAFAGQDLEKPAETILWDGARVRWDDFPEAAPGKEAFVNELAVARTTFGRPFLSYGRMLRPPAIETTPIKLDFHQRFYGWGAEGWRNDGSWHVPDVTISAWEGPRAEIGIVMVNLREDASVDIPLSLDVQSLWSVDRRGRAVSIVTRDGSTPVGV